MKKLFTLVVALLLSVTGYCFGQDYNFETTAEEMVEKLSNPGAPAKSGYMRTRSLPGVEQEPIRTRTIKVVAKEKHQAVEKLIVVPVKRPGGYVNLKIEFDFDSFVLRPSSLRLLDELAKALNDPKLEGKSVLLNGHTDSDGYENYNLHLSLNRAISVKNYLVFNHRIPTWRLKVMGYGEAMPLVNNDTNWNKQINRRVEVVTAE